mgnify:CR=1 FL=1
MCFLVEEMKMDPDINEAKKAGWASFSMLTYSRPDDAGTQGGVLLAFLARALGKDGFLSLKGGAEHLGFLFLYELFTEAKRVRFEDMLDLIDVVFTTSGMETDPTSTVTDFTPALTRTATSPVHAAAAHTIRQQPPNRVRPLEAWSCPRARIRV